MANQFDDMFEEVSSNPQSFEDLFEVSPSLEDQVREERSFKPVTSFSLESAANLGTDLVQGLEREEAALAEPLLNLVRGAKEPVFGEERPDESLLDAAGRGLGGETFSKFKQGRQAELGDIGRELGLPEPLSAGLGLIGSSVLLQIQAL